jgi:tRNA(Glu) U13 pseudouridine synthase TruD
MFAFYKVQISANNKKIILKFFLLSVAFATTFAIREITHIKKTYNFN